MAHFRAVARQIGAVALAQYVLERLRLGVRLRVDGVPLHYRIGSPVIAAVTGEMRKTLGVTTECRGRPLSSASEDRLSKLACGDCVSVSTMPSRPWMLPYVNAAARSGTMGRPPERRPGRRESMTQITSTAVSPALRMAISARSPAP